MAYNQLAFRYTTGRASNLAALIWNRDRTAIRTSGTTFTAIGSVADANFAAGRLTATEQTTSNSTGTQLYRLSAFPAVAAGFYHIDIYDVTTPSSSSPGPTDVPIPIADSSSLVYWNGSSLSDSATAGVIIPNIDGDGSTTLDVDYSILLRRIGLFLGYERDPNEWDVGQLEDVIEIIATGLRNFYWPVLPEPHTWSFLRPTDSLSVSAGDRDYDLPADFAGLNSHGFSYATNSKLQRITRMSEDDMRSWYATEEKAGPPKYYAIRAKAPVEGEPQRYEVLFHPVPDASYTLSYRYTIIPNLLDGTNTHPLGGAMHSETIVEACLAAAEKTLCDESGLHEQRFQACLAASLLIDKEML